MGTGPGGGGLSSAQQRLRAELPSPGGPGAPSERKRLRPRGFAGVVGAHLPPAGLAPRRPALVPSAQGRLSPTARRSRGEAPVRRGGGDGGDEKTGPEAAHGSDLPHWPQPCRRGLPSCLPAVRSTELSVGPERKQKCAVPWLLTVVIYTHMRPDGSRRLMALT